MTDKAEPFWSRERVARRLALGFGTQTVAHATQIGLQLALVPVCLAGWGAEVYGDWLLLAAAANLLGLVDLGLQGCLGNHLRLAWMRGDEAAGHRVLRTGLGVYAGLTAAALALAGLLATTLDLGAAALAHAPATLFLLMAGVAAQLPRGLVATVYTARGHFNREVAAFIVLQLGQQGTLIAGAALGAPPVAVAAATLVAGLVFGWGWLLWDLRRWRGGAALTPQWPSRTELRQLAAQAPFHAVQQVAGVLAIQVPVVALGLLAGPAATVAFSTMRTVAGLARALAAQFATATGLELARLQACGDDAAAARLLAATTPLAAAMTGLAAGVTVVLGPAFFRLWTHGAVAFDPLLAAAFLGTLLLAAPTMGAASMLRLVDARGAVVAGAQAWQVLLAVLACALLAGPAGALGAALAVGIAELAAAPLLTAAAARRLGRPLAPAILRGHAVAAAALAVALAVGLPLTGW